MQCGDVLSVKGRGNFLSKLFALCMQLWILVSARSWSPFRGMIVLSRYTFFPVKHNLSSSTLPHKRAYQNSGVADCLAMDFDVQCLRDCVLPRQVMITTILFLSPGPTCHMEKL